MRRLAVVFPMKWRNWWELLMPTLLVGLAWLTVSSATTVYISWLDRRHQAILNENVASIQAAAVMQHCLWELDTATPATAAAASSPSAVSPSAQPADVIAEFQAALEQASLSAHRTEEEQIVAKIEESFAGYLRERLSPTDSGDRSPPADTAAALADEIADQCDQLRRFNQELIEQRTVEHLVWSNAYRNTRLLLNLLGPLIGVWLGYRVASRLRQRLAAIHVRLEGAVGELGQVLVEPSVPDGNLDAIDRQVRDVATRLHEVLEELASVKQAASRNERLAAVGHLAAGVAHELRNPLTAVKLLVQTTAQKAATNGSSLPQLAVVQDEIGRMENTIQSLLDFARPTATQRIRCDLRQTLRQALNLVQGRAEQEKICVVFRDEPRPLWITCDPEKLHQVFVNLLLNGMDAMPEGGELTIETRRREIEPRGETAAAIACEVIVGDQGEGIPAELLDRIFEPFVTGKARGIGLGLAISRRLVEEHGGSLTAANRSGRGAEFTVRLPCEALAPEASQSEASATPSQRTPNRSEVSKASKVCTP